MRSVALDVGRRIAFAEAQGGEIVKRGVGESIEELLPFLGPETREAKVALEACREAWHFHDVLTAWGHEVLLVDTTRARQMGIGHHKKKNDRIDAATMALAVEAGRIPQAHVLAPSRRRMREKLTVRRHLTKTRAAYASEVRGLLRARGVSVPKCYIENIVSVTRKSCPVEHLEAVEPLLSLIEQLNPHLLQLDIDLEQLAKSEPTIALLKTAPGVANVVATAFVSVIDEPARFKTAHQVEAYLGLVPSENTSGKTRLGGITKQGNAYLRAMLIQAAWCILRLRGSNPLKVWALSVARRRNRKVIAAVALARRLAGILWAMWRDGTVFEARRVGQSSALGLERQARTTLAVADGVRRVAQDRETIAEAQKYAAHKTSRAIRKAVSESP
jgi:transposase